MSHMQRLPNPAIHRWVLGVAMGHTPSRVAEVTESRVANRVTSIPRATNPSVSRLATDSHGP